MKRVHFIAIGGSAMHNLALALHHKGYAVTGSDDEINEPSRSRLAAAGILPAHIGWFPEKIDAGLEAVILGMHARSDNPELLRARALKLPVFSYPEYLYEQSRDKHRVVIAGSHGKTTITAMILHVLKAAGKKTDFMVGAQLAGFDTMVQMSNDAPVIVLEGDEYLASPEDRRPKFLLYHPQTVLISGIAWDHVNVFPTFDEYVEQFRKLVRTIPPEGTLVYCAADEVLSSMVTALKPSCKVIPYGLPAYELSEGITRLHKHHQPGKKVSLQIFGQHNLMNLEGARMICALLGVSDEQFYDAIAGFRGAARRLEKIGENVSGSVMFRDFAHSTSKLKATVQAVREQFSDRRLVACMELHTFSSLSAGFLEEYRGSMEGADLAIVYYNPATLEHKKLPSITPEQVKEHFGTHGLEVYTDREALLKRLQSITWKKTNLLMMSSGTFDGIDFQKLAGVLYTTVSA
jgi:UDP-N-acetylmuramate: L-alanyl-gamma-D-glutamyl-meso-diaminopimelate ligase